MLVSLTSLSFHSISFSCEKRADIIFKADKSGDVSIQLVSLARRELNEYDAEDLKYELFPFN